MKKFLIFLFISAFAFASPVFAGMPCTLGGGSPSLSGCNYVTATISNGTDITLTNGVPSNSYEYFVFSGSPSLAGTYNYGQNGYSAYFSQPFTLTATEFSSVCNTYPCEGLLVFLDSHADWVNYGDTGSVSFSYDGSGHFTITGASMPPFLGFPLECSTSTCSGTGNISYVAYGAYTASSVISVVDHSMTTPYSDEDGVVTAWNGETGEGTPVNLGCYPKGDESAFSLEGIYVGSPGDGCTTHYLNYDNHPGYDYKAATGTPVKAVAAGTVVTFGEQRCIPKGIATAGCEAWGAVGIDHGNGYITQYLHMSDISVDAGDPVSANDAIGLSGNTSPGSLGAHLHFEVLRQLPNTDGTSIDDYEFVDPYGWSGEDADPLETVTGFKNTCLWVDGC
jgi:murein DD-endopeptidase MepM/ murein hydrolase activator NlpD